MNNYDIKEVATRIKSVREDLDLSIEYMAQRTKISIEEYRRFESGREDLPLSFLFICAETLGIDMVELFTGTSPKLQKYSIVRCGKGYHVERRAGFEYKHLAYLFKNKKIEPLFVTCKFDAKTNDSEVYVSSHDGQEMNYILSGQLKFVIDGCTEILSEGDCIYFDASYRHGMVATGGKDCEFLTVLI